MIVAYSFVDAATETARTEFESAMRARSREVESFPGFLRFEFRREAGRRGRYVIATWWESRSDLKRWLSSAQHASTHTRLSDECRAQISPPRVEVHDVLEVSVG